MLVHLRDLGQTRAAGTVTVDGRSTDIERPTTDAGLRAWRAAFRRAPAR